MYCSQCGTYVEDDMLFLSSMWKTVKTNKKVCIRCQLPLTENERSLSSLWNETNTRRSSGRRSL